MELGFGPPRPWGYVFWMAVEDDKFWETEVDRPAHLNCTDVLPRAALFSDGTLAFPLPSAVL